MQIPTKKKCIKILKENKTPPNVVAHCKRVCEVALKVCSLVEKKGVKVNKGLVQAAALLHDVEKLKKDHVIAGHNFVKKLGFNKVADVIIKHGFEHIKDKKYHPVRIEDKIVFYADKRVLDDKVVSVYERLEYIKKRYGLDINGYLRFTKKIEKELLNGEKIS